MTRRRDLPLVYACSGCSDVAQLANDVAVRLDHSGKAEMSCISGVGGGVPALVRIARSGRPIIAIDGCPLHCAAACLANCDVEADEHVRLYEQGYRKRIGRRADAAEVEKVTAHVEGLIELLNLEQNC
ncbi:putative zinc-binding protein [Marinobacterium sp. D7]|uniref:putative zinc-binding protein n=1 Tax=Marinobacterium ramblicola TaxID=2849041 RepID=UPI001C2CD89C|nr:putative zinc-binding protein [Marinobacterium ramblicola]MBV1787537.1 putative zinc-binding protein [Marinobacterium ramblicola]